MKKWKISDFVLIGLLAAIDAAVIYGVGNMIWSDGGFETNTISNRRFPVLKRDTEAV